jgi:hypothetical protein
LEVTPDLLSIKPFCLRDILIEELFLISPVIVSKEVGSAANGYFYKHTLDDDFTDCIVTLCFQSPAIW